MKAAAATEADCGEAASGQPCYRLHLYISGATPRSAQAVASLKEVAEERLRGRYDLEVIDAYQQAELLRDEQVLVLPTLVKQLPLPLRRMVGDKRIAVMLTLSPMHDDSGAIAGISTVAHHITSRKHAEAELRRSSL